MSTNLKEIFSQIDDLNEQEKLEVFDYLKQHLQAEFLTDTEENKTYEPTEVDEMLQYIADKKSNPKRQRSLQEFRGIAPNLLEGQDAQEWVNQLRDEWAERERSWRSEE
ncbi:MAG: hypothetical protein SAL07_24240 [Oscillatoria sp. PMC 1051.18]|nr:hypothetical protein [Oscillatoria sp. PMC 1050.18]MEC5033021.1 hypothetical protein [Oscillatoria sp. PMC 1051.18]